MANFVASTWRDILTCFVTGLAAILPLALTIAIVVWVAGFIEGFIGQGTVIGGFLRNLGLMFASDVVVAYVIGWIIVLVLVFVLGIVVRIGLYQLIERAMNGLIRRIPVIGNVYQTAEQLVNMLKKKDASELQGMSVVFCVFSKENGSGVLALMPSPETIQIDGRGYHVVLIPTAPVPFGGALLFMPAELVHPSNVSVEGLMSIYVSMGVTVPQYLDANKTSR